MVALKQVRVELVHVIAHAAAVVVLSMAVLVRLAMAYIFKSGIKAVNAVSRVLCASYEIISQES